MIKEGEMKINIFFIFITLLCCFLFSGACCAEKHKERVGNSTDVINEIMGIPKKGSPSDLLKCCRGVAHLPQCIKGRIY